MHYIPLCIQPYRDCKFIAGRVEGAKLAIDDCYIEFNRDGEEPTIILMTRDELLAVAWVATGAVWGMIQAERLGEEPQNHVPED